MAYAPGIYLTSEEVARKAREHPNNPIMQQLLFLTQQTELLQRLLRRAGDNLRPSMDDETNAVHEEIEAYFEAFHTKA